MMREKMDRRILLIIAAIWIAAIGFGFLVRQGQGTWIDNVLLQAIHAGEFPRVAGLMKGITFTGDPLFYVIANSIGIIVLLRKRMYPELLCLLAAVLLGWGLNEGMKHLFMRIRPTGYALIEQGGYSYPSGHAMVALAWYPTAGYLLQFGRPRMEPWACGLALYGFLPGISRVLLGVHYPTDVFFGHLLGMTLAYTSMRFYREHIHRRNNNELISSRENRVYQKEYSRRRHV